MRDEVHTTVSFDVSVCRSVTLYSPCVHKLPKKKYKEQPQNSRCQKGGITPTTIRCHKIFYSPYDLHPRISARLA